MARRWPGGGQEVARRWPGGGQEVAAPVLGAGVSSPSSLLTPHSWAWWQAFQNLIFQVQVQVGVEVQVEVQVACGLMHHCWAAGAADFPHYTPLRLI